jgi:hypothetical protein
MEIVGSSVAISQILEKVASFYILYSEAPGAIQNVRDKLGFIALHNSVIQQIVEDSAYHELSINQEQMKLLTACLYSALETLESVHEECEKIVSKASKRRSGRLTFAAWDHKRAEEILRRLNGCESSLNSAITLLRL